MTTALIFVGVLLAWAFLLFMAKRWPAPPELTPNQIAMRRMTARFRLLERKFGGALLPAVVKANAALADFGRAFQKIVEDANSQAGPEQ